MSQRNGATTLGVGWIRRFWRSVVSSITRSRRSVTPASVDNAERNMDEGRMPVVKG
jgi:hypothetical protein